MGLFATMPVNEVMVQDIAVAVDMTPAAVYYHFASKEQILIEGMQQFRDELLDEVREHLPDDGDEAGVRTLIATILGWVRTRRTYATVYYVNSTGFNMTVEALRRDTRAQLFELFRAAVRAARPSARGAEAAVVAVGLVSLVETAIASMLNQDASYRGTGARRFPAEVAATADRMVGLDA